MMLTKILVRTHFGMHGFIENTSNEVSLLGRVNRKLISTYSLRLGYYVYIIIYTVQRRLWFKETVSYSNSTDITCRRCYI